MKLRTRLNLVLTGVTTLFVAALVADEIRDARASVREEIEAANRVAGHIIESLVLTYAAAGGTPAVRAMLEQLGHVRANDLTLHDASGRLIYYSPPPAYKAGREAPAWFTHLLAPPPARLVFTLGDGARGLCGDHYLRAITEREHLPRRSRCQQVRKPHRRLTPRLVGGGRRVIDELP